MFGFRRLAIIAMLFASPVLSQTQTATVRGVVTDSSGGVVANASVTLLNVDQNRPYTFKTNSAGEYVLVQIPPGNYSLDVEVPGFKQYKRTGLALEVAQALELDVALEVGSITESVQVDAQAPLLESASSTLGEVVNTRTIENLPLNGRNAMQLVALTPGINTTPSYRSSTTGSGSISAVGFSANGGRNVSNSIILDGSPQEVMGYNQPVYIPTPDALQEFKVETNALSAEYGRTGGAVVNLVHRSGTKDFHSLLYEFLRNDKFDANNFFNNRNGVAKGAFRFNQFGGTFGGPLTKSRQTTFFFFNYEGVRVVNPASTTLSVPTAAMKAGDFSGIGTTIYDPATIDASGKRQPFAGNKIPSSRFDPVATKILSYYPDPIQPGIVNNFFSSKGSHTAIENISTKIDRRVTDRQNLFGRFSWYNENAVAPNSFNDIASNNFGTNGIRGRSVTLDDVWLPGTWVLHGNYGYGYSANPRDHLSEGLDLTTLGFPAAVKNVAQFPIFPRIEPAGYEPLGGDPTYIIGNKFETHTFTGDATRILGDHTLKLGGSWRINRVSNFRPNSPAGHYVFDEGWTRQIFNGNSGGNAIASMLLGDMASGNLQREPALALQVLYAALYLQDDWRVNSRLMLNIGLRWDSDRPMTERFNRLSWFNVNAPLPVAAPGVPQLHGGLIFAGRDGTPRGNKDPDNNNFAPRIGLAWKMTNKLVARSGFGIFYSPTTGDGPGAGSVGAISFNAVTNVTSSTDGNRSPYAKLSNPFPDGFNTASNGAGGLLTNLGQSLNGIFRGDRTPYTAQWNFDLQYELPSGMLLDTAYAGNAGIKQLAQTQLNQLPDRDLALGDQLTQVVGNPFFGVIPATSSIGKATTTYGQLLRPFPQFTGVQQTWGSLAHSSYHSLQIKFRKRYTNGLQLLAAYTWSKLLDDYSSVAGFLGEVNPGYIDNNDRRTSKSLSAGDVAHRLVLNYEYELPFGAGKRFLNAKGFLNAVAGGWNLNGITTIQSGLPIQVTERNDTTNSFGGAQLPDSTGKSSKTPGSPKDRIDNYFDKTAFADPPKYAFGNTARLLPDNRGPYLIDFDLSVLKRFPIAEKKRLEFRAEFFNMLNNVNFANPTGNATVFGRPQFGTLTAAENARIVQLGLKLYF